MSLVVLVWQPEADLVGVFPFLFSAWSEMDKSGWTLVIMLAALVVGIGIGLAGAYQMACLPSACL